MEEERSESDLLEFLKANFPNGLRLDRKDVKYIEERGLLYEINAKGEKTLVNSTSSEKRVYIRFTNKSSRPVDIWWRDFRGVKHHYLCLGPGAFSDINTYVTHPWQFTDSATNESFVINNSLIFRAPEKLGGMLFRTNWNITVGVRSLKYCVMLAIAQNVQAPCCVKNMGLPKKLEKELLKLAEVVLMEETLSAHEAS